MYLTITIEDLVSNALIELVENDISRTVSYPTIMKYGETVVKELEERNIKAKLDIYRVKTIQFEYDYKDIFDFYEKEGIGYIKLKENINTNYLRTHFRTNQTLDELIALTSDNSKKVLGINIDKKKVIPQKIKKKDIKNL